MCTQVEVAAEEDLVKASAPLVIYEKVWPKALTGSWICQTEGKDRLKVKGAKVNAVSSPPRSGIGTRDGELAGSDSGSDGDRPADCRNHAIQRQVEDYRLSDPGTDPAISSEAREAPPVVGASVSLLNKVRNAKENECYNVGGSFTQLHVYKIRYESQDRGKDPLHLVVSDYALLVAHLLDEAVTTAPFRLYLPQCVRVNAILEYQGVVSFNKAQLHAAKASHIITLKQATVGDYFSEINRASNTNGAIDPSQTRPVSVITARTTCKNVPGLQHDCQSAHNRSGHWMSSRAYLLVPFAEGSPSLIANAYGSSFESIREGTFSRVRRIVDSEAHDSSNQKTCISVDQGKQMSKGDSMIKLQLANGCFTVEEIDDSLVTTIHLPAHHCVVAISADQTAESPFPSDRKKPAIFSNFVDYFDTKYKLKLKHPCQPLVQLKCVPSVTNMLIEREHVSAPGASATSSSTRRTSAVLVPPELCFRHKDRNGRTMRGAQRLPSVMNRVENIQLASELKAIIGVGNVSTLKILEALTASGCREGYSYERHEIVGDAYIKYAISRHLFFSDPPLPESALASQLEAAVGNKHLFSLAHARGLPRYMVAEPFDPTTWQAPGLGESVPYKKVPHLSPEQWLDVLQQQASALKVGEGTGDPKEVGALENGEAAARSRSLETCEQQPARADPCSGPGSGFPVPLPGGEALHENQSRQSAYPGLGTGTTPSGSAAAYRSSGPAGQQSADDSGGAVEPALVALAFAPAPVPAPASMSAAEPVRRAEGTGRVTPAPASAPPVESARAAEKPAAPGRLQTMSRKMVADVAEALVAVSLSEAGEDAAVQVMLWLGLPCDFCSAYRSQLSRPPGAARQPGGASPHSLSSGAQGAPATCPSPAEQPTGQAALPDAAGGETPAALIEANMPSAPASSSPIFNIIGPVPPPCTLAQAANAEAVAHADSSARKVELILGYTFQRRWLLAKALLVPAPGSPEKEVQGKEQEEGEQGKEGKEVDVWSFERLSYLGNGLLDYLHTQHLVDAHQGLEPGPLTKLKHAALNKECLARASVRCGLHNHLCNVPEPLAGAVAAFAAAQEEEERRAVLEVTLGDGRGYVHTFGLAEQSAPRELANVVETVAAAMLVDTHLDYARVWQWMEKILQPFPDPQTAVWHPIVAVQQYCQSHYWKSQIESFPDIATGLQVGQVLVNGHVIATHLNASKQAARRLAAAAAYKIVFDPEFPSRLEQLRQADDKKEEATCVDV